MIFSSPAWVFWSIFLFLTASFFSHPQFGNEKYCFGGKTRCDYVGLGVLLLKSIFRSHQASCEHKPPRRPRFSHFLCLFLFLLLYPSSFSCSFSIPPPLLQLLLLLFLESQPQWFLASTPSFTPPEHNSFPAHFF